MIELPKFPIKAEVKNPEFLIVFSKPKTGKTSLFATLKDSLLLDLEKGSKFVDAVKIKAENVSEIVEIGKQIIAEGKPYKYIIVDTATALEELCIPYAEELYSKSAIGKNWYTEGKPKYRSIINLPNGAGYQWVRDAFSQMLNYIGTWAPNIILLAHIKETLQEKNGTEFTASEIDLIGKIKRITASKSDAIGYLYRKGDKNILSFKTSDTVACGARPIHLRNRDIVVSEFDKDGNYITYLNEIYID